MADPARSGYAAQIEEWRERRLERLTGPTGWLSLTGLHWLEEGDNGIGADPASRVALPAGTAPPRAGLLRVTGGQVRLEPSPDAAFEIGGQRIAGPSVLVTDASEGPTVFTLGNLTLEVLARSGRLAVRVRHAENPARQSLRPIPIFPVDRAWRFDAVFEAYDPPKTIPITSILGTVEQETCPGAIAFSAGGRRLRLEPILERGEKDYWVIFGDLTNGHETYGGGRFVYVPPPVFGRTVLDFNKAYNPPCVFTPYTTCPLPPPQNRLPIRVEAGEKKYEG